MANRPRRTRAPRRSPRPPPGSAPGTLAIDRSLPPPEMRLMAYGPEALEERRLQRPEEFAEVLRSGKWPVVWLDVDGLGDAAALETIAVAAGLHRLSLADVVNVNQRPKVEDYGSYLFIVTRMPVQTALDAAAAPGAPRGDLDTEQVSLCLGHNFVLTFQERAKPGDCFGGVRERVRQSGNPIRSRAADYLAYALLDGAIDAYFPVLETLGEDLEQLEQEAMGRLDPAAMRRLHRIRREFLIVRRAAWPLREAVGALHRDRSPLISDDTRVYLRDLYDHTVQIIDLVETGRELGAALMEMHLTMASHRMNEIIKVLTIITTIFIPLSFIAGIYGMNFDPDSGPYNMPELRWRFGYPAVLLAMTAIAAVMVFAFWRRGWIGRGARRPRDESLN